MDFSRFNENLTQFKKEVQEARDKRKAFEPLPTGKYEVGLDYLQIKETKSGGSLMLNGCMTILAGDFKNRKIFLNFGLWSGATIQKACDFLNSLDTDVKVDFNEIESFEKFEELVKVIAYTVGSIGLEYEIEYSKAENNGREYENYKITQVFEG